MEQSLIRAAVGVLLLAGVPACTAQAPSGLRQTPDTTSATIALPLGQSAAGRQAIQDLRCTACHAVPSEPSFPAPVSDTPGPPFDAALASRDMLYVTTAIVNPSHQISLRTSPELRARLEGALSPMGDFSGIMTVRQLVDIHAYLRSVAAPR
jgi:hypothetical protein